MGHKTSHKKLSKKNAGGFQDPKALLVGQTRFIIDLVIMAILENIFAKVFSKKKSFVFQATKPICERGGCHAQPSNTQELDFAQQGCLKMRLPTLISLINVEVGINMEGVQKMRNHKNVEEGINMQRMSEGSEWYQIGPK